VYHHLWNPPYLDALLWWCSPEFFNGKLVVWDVVFFIPTIHERIIITSLMPSFFCSWQSDTRTHFPQFPTTQPVDLPGKLFICSVIFNSDAAAATSSSTVPRVRDRCRWSADSIGIFEMASPRNGMIIITIICIIVDLWFTDDYYHIDKSV
jgi:hypothetical protein